MPPPRPRLTALLFTPGSRLDRVDRAVASGADGVILDLEDSIGAGEKDAVRADVIAWLQRHGRAGTPPFVTAVRFNSLRTPHGRSDLDAFRAAQVRPEWVMLPKVESPGEILWVQEKLGADVRIVALIETILGVRHVAEIAGAGPTLAALAFGGLDLSAETGGEPTWDALLWPRTAVVHACAAAGLAALDQPYIDFNDLAGLNDECARSRALGFVGRLAIHPKQCGPIRAAYQPTDAQVARARKIVAAYDGARGNVVSVDGQMIDVPIYRAAQRVLHRAGE
ncbi:MAG TPA: CoA ester lyase [Opitutaceae bacterium]|nr:CoA ester lyase [Opitutaceae bacterium]